MTSVWTDNSGRPNFEKLGKDIKTDVLVIGGGIAGILCASKLKEAGVRCTLVESQKICDGVTANTTAKITVQHGLIYDKLIREFGTEGAKIYLDANQMALSEYRRLCTDIDCDFEEKSAYVYTLENREKIEKEISALDRIGYKADFCDTLPIPLDITGAERFNRQAQFDPLKFLFHIAKGLDIYENTTVRELVGTTAFTKSGRITAERIIVATHFPFINKHGSYFVKMYQQRSYVTALKNAQNVDGMYIGEAENSLSFRNYGDLLLLGGGGHRTGKQGSCWNELEAFAKLKYPEAVEKYRFATQDCISLDGVPYIGHYSSATPRLYVATGFNKWGMTSAMVSALILTDLITGKDNPYAPLFSPSRTILRPKLAVNLLESTVNLLTFSKKRCPHLGCALKRNKAEHSWDCPCHGSRFSDEGKLLDNPATGNLN